MRNTKRKQARGATRSTSARAAGSMRSESAQGPAGSSRTSTKDCTNAIDLGTFRRHSAAMTDREFAYEALTKVPAVTLGFWIIKILATTLGETGGDTVTMTWLGETTQNAVPGGYLIGTAICGILLILLVWAQIRARAFNPWLYWATIVASTTCGTTLADFADRSLGIGYPGGSLLLFACVLASLSAWYQRLGSIDVSRITGPSEETFY